MQENNDDQNNYSLGPLSKNIEAGIVKDIYTFNKMMFLIIEDGFGGSFYGVKTGVGLQCLQIDTEFIWQMFQSS